MFSIPMQYPVSAHKDLAKCLRRRECVWILKIQRRPLGAITRLWIFMQDAMSMLQMIISVLRCA